MTLLRSLAVIGLLAMTGLLSGEVTPPHVHFGFAIGEDYHLATFKDTEAYLKRVGSESERVRYVDIGSTEEARRQPMLIVTSPQNHARIERYREISQLLARAETLTDAKARALADEGRAVVWIDGGLHANETVGTHQLIESVHRFATATDPETMRILDDVIILFTHCNPDGQELISSWYMRRPVPEERLVDLQPRLYQKYAGHDNNRDFFAMAMKESANINRQLYVDWLPQIVYNHHQSAPPGTIISGPPYRDPFNYVFDPLLVTSIDAIGAAMNNRFNAEGKGGVAQRRGAPFSTWWNGGLRTTPYFHNQIGILTEIVGSPTPMDIPLLPERQVPSGDLPAPVAPQRWHFRQSIEYSLSANYAVLDYASRHRDQLLYNIYLMGKASIERGSRDHWTSYPSRVEAMRRAFLADRKAAQAPAGPDASERFAAYNMPGIPPGYFAHLRKPEDRDPRGYILPSDQPDFPTAVTFVNMLIKGGVAVERATQDFDVAGKTYPAGSYVVRTAQAFRPHVLDLFEPQDHPNDFLHEGGPPIAPYDSAGWTPAFLMGVSFDRILDGFDGPFARIPWGEIQPPPTRSITGDASAGYLFSAAPLNSFKLVNRLLAAGLEVFRLPQGVDGDAGFGPGSLFIPAQTGAAPLIRTAVAELGLSGSGISRPPPAPRIKVERQRIALWDVYGGSMPSGWTRWLLEQHEFPFQLIYPGQIDAGRLREHFDVLILPSGAVPLPRSPNGPPVRASYGLRQPKPANIPSEYHDWLGVFSEDKTVPALRDFVEAGGTIVAVGTSAQLAYHLNLPVSNALVEHADDGREQRLTREKFYVPGSVLRAAIDPGHPAAWGMPTEADVYFDNNPVLRLKPEAVVAGVKPIAWFASPTPLRSGWAWGQAHLHEGILAVDLPVGLGRVRLLTPEVTFRAQSHGTFKLLFNALHGHASAP
jgi:hypothetical protein